MALCQLTQSVCVVDHGDVMSRWWKPADLSIHQPRRQRCGLSEAWSRDAWSGLSVWQLSGNPPFLRYLPFVLIPVSDKDFE
ncbi:hypothetical protein SynA1560_01682 [Synechococcus sp. A15-60]|nr:hypothetical protein SynA1560_01682 [Synechococcus sp. A15-60]